MNKQWSEELKYASGLFQNTTLIHLFQHAVRYDPDREALLADGCMLSYGELDIQSNQVANALLESGIQGNEIIGVATGRCKEAILVFLGAWKIGCACLYLDEECPSYRNEECIEECEVRHCITKTFVEQAVQTQSGILGKETQQVKPENLAVVVYTSGSTGKPKGVLLTQKNLVASVSNFGELGFCSNDRYGCFANLMFVAAVYDMAVTFSIGACFCLIPKEIRKNISRIADYYNKNRISVTFLPPIMARKYQEIDGNSSLRILLSGSEAVRGLKPRPYKIINVYASSESCAIACYYVISEEKFWYPIGHAVGNMKVYVVDEHGEQVQTGEEGELWLAGPQISEGYLKKPEATEKHFVKNPFCQEPIYAKVYKTADLVSVNASGELEYRGRKDTMVKIRGFRVELTGIEKWILRYPGIKDACCTAFMDAGGTNLLFGYYISDVEIDHEQLRRFLAEHVPYYMIPLGLIRCQEFPRTLTGKVNRRGFPVPLEINDHKRAAEIYR